MTTYIKPFDFKTILVDTFLGKSELIVFAIIFLLSVVAGKRQMNGKLFMILLVAASLIFSAVLGQAIYILIIVIIGMVTFKSITRIVT